MNHINAAWCQSTPTPQLENQFYRADADRSIDIVTFLSSHISFLPIFKLYEQNLVLGCMQRQTEIELLAVRFNAASLAGKCR